MEQTCDRCGEVFTAGRSDARYCSGRCRTIAYRNRAEPDRPPARRRPLPDALREKVYVLGRAVASLERLTTDDRMKRTRASVGPGPGNDVGRMLDQLARIRERL